MATLKPATYEMMVKLCREIRQYNTGRLFETLLLETLSENDFTNYVLSRCNPSMNPDILFLGQIIDSLVETIRFVFFFFKKFDSENFFSGPPNKNKNKIYF